MMTKALSDVAAAVSGTAGHVLTGIAAENISGGTLWLQLFDAVIAYDAAQKTAARVATTAALIDNGWIQAGAGVGATLTSPDDNVAHNDFDDVTTIANDRVLVKDEVTADRYANGIYVMTTPADGAGQEAVLTRATDFDAVAEIVENALVRVTAGTVATGLAYRVTTAPETVDTDPIVFAASWTPVYPPIRVATATRVQIPFRRLTRAGLGPFVTGIAYGWSTQRDTFVPTTTTATNLALWLHHSAP